MLNTNKFSIYFLSLAMMLYSGCSKQKKANKVNYSDSSTTANPIAIIETNSGPLVLELYLDKAPETVKNFVGLARSGFYDNLIFHRIIANFMIQGGDPTGTGTGGPGYAIKDEINPTLKHDKEGVLAMAHSGPNTAGSQFYITLVPTPWLDGQYTIFGQLIRGSQTLQSIGVSPTDRRDKPLEDVVIRRITIQEFGNTYQ
ncbi:peptidylprolyl isomerase [PVC group bacterium (ex Bugula neritina AB1)]|nr:peptidylprolyl isomerase [PVC group bacterium (ex Bugula neritina AB1)]